MIDYFRGHLGAKIFLSYLVIIVLGVTVLIVASQFVLPASFNRHMAGMMDGGMMGMGMGSQGPGNSDPMSQLYFDFRASFNEALAYAALVAAAAALSLSAFFSRRVAAPLSAMAHATQRIAEGRYDERVQVDGADELAQLAVQFNQMASHLEKAEGMRRQLIGDVSHELRTPLTSIKGYMEGLMDGVLPPGPETYEQVHKEAERLARLVDDLQELSRVEAKAYALDLRPVEVTSLVQTALKRLSPQTQKKRIAVQANLPPDLPPVLADVDRITQVLMNLAGNAILYTPEGGSVTITAAHRGGEVHISVSDTGIGISEEHLAHIFDRFYRADKSRARQSGGGSGIGLTIARALVEAHGGQIWADSAGEGQGSTFLFTLPAAK
jgi:histidine kinase